MRGKDKITYKEIINKWVIDLILQTFDPCKEHLLRFFDIIM